MRPGELLEMLHVEMHARWSDQAFGDPEFRGPEGPLDHLLKEAKEAADNPGDREELADCLMLILDANRRHCARQGLPAYAAFQLLVMAFRDKLIKNMQRKWDQADPTKAVEHDRSLDTIGGDGDGE